MKPHRVQLSRKKGWKMPPNTIRVSRPSKWGNPFVVGKYGTQEQCVKLYAQNIGLLTNAVVQELRGKNLACWCPVWRCANGHRFGEEIKRSNVPKYCPTCSRPLERVPCHADVLLEIANT